MSTASSVLETAGLPCCPTETWAPIPDWPHEASTCGRLRSITRLGDDGVWRIGTILPQYPDKRKGKGYLYADLVDGKRRRKVHVAVAVLEAHQDVKPGRDYEACHSGPKTDNHLALLRWDTKAANLAEMWEARRARAELVTTTPSDTLKCHKTQVREGAVSFPVCHSSIVTGDSLPGTGRCPFLFAFPLFFMSVQSSLRSLRSLRSRKTA